MSDAHNHENCIGCGCYSPAIDLLLNRKSSDKTKASPQRKVKATAAATSTLFHSGRIYPVQKKGADGKIIEMEDTNFHYEAMGIKDGEIEWLGTTEEALKRKANYKEVIDLDGQTILPGLVEPHCHIVPSAVAEFSEMPESVEPFKGMKVWQNYLPFKGQFLDEEYSRQSLLDRVTRLAEDISTKNLNSSENFWLLGNGVDPSLMKEVYPDEEYSIINCVGHEFFSEIEHTKEAHGWRGEVPPIVLISASGHTAYVNKTALKKAWEHAVENENYTFLDAYGNDMDAYTTNDNCVLQELVQMMPVLAAINQVQVDSLKNSVENSIDKYIEAARKFGVTMMYDAGMTQIWAESYFIEKNKFSTEYTSHDRGVRIGMSMPYAIENAYDVADNALNGFFDEYEYAPPTKQSINAYWGSIKITSDGSNQGLTGYQSEKYACECLLDPNENGVYNFNTQAAIETNAAPTDEDPGTENNNAVVKKIVEKGWPILIHANGNQAIEYTIEAYKNSIVESTVSIEGFRKMRHRIEHCSLLNEDNLTDMKNLGIQPSFLIGHVGYWGNVFDNYIFPSSQSVNSAVDHLDLCKTALDKTLRISLHSDNSVSPMGPLRYMEQAHTRIMEGSQAAKAYYVEWSKLKNKEDADFESLPVLKETEQISLVQALKAITIDAAWQCQADHLVGSLLPGKLADFIVLEQDPMQMDTLQKAYLNLRDIKVRETWIGGVKYANS